MIKNVLQGLLTLEEFEENKSYQRLVKQITYKVMMQFWDETC